MNNPIDFNDDGKINKDDAVAFYRQKPFYAGLVVGFAVGFFLKLIF